ncbi:MAG TPA: lyase family protein [Thermomicrobiales bacterium]|nr:lyase family protein [Thermomicrobiales bacterium]
MSQRAQRPHPYALLVTAHVAMLGKQGLIDDAAVRVLAGVVDRTATGAIDSDDLVGGLLELDARVDSQSPQGFAGAAQVGRGINELVAALARVILRDSLLELAEQVDQLREDLIDLGIQHVVTIMPAYQQGVAAQPTTLAHLLGGLIGPYDRVDGTIRQTYALVNRSPLGAGALVSTGLPIDREDAAANAGFDGAIENTFDAVAATDHFAAVAHTIRAVASPIRRFMAEIATLYRTDPSSLILHDASPRMRSELPQHSIIPAFDDLERLLVDLDAVLGTVDRWLERAPLEPIAEISRLLDRLALAFATTGRLIDRFRAFLNREIAFNRAYLANRANRNHTTVGELADFLMLEEQIPPAQARAMTGRVMAQLKDEGLETSGITSAMIDSAGMLVLGRELGVEFESLSKYLAPRRFIERRGGLGGPAPMAIRDWLTREQAALASDRAWIAERRAALTAAEAAMRALADEE